MEHNRFYDEDKHSDFTQLPNILDDMELSPYAVRLYLHIKRRAGETGNCFESSKKIAKHCMMSEGKVSACKKELEKAGLIQIKTVKGKHGEFDYHNITIKDIWEENHLWYSLVKEVRDDVLCTHEKYPRSSLNNMVIEGHHWDGSRRE